MVSRCVGSRLEAARNLNLNGHCAIDGYLRHLGRAVLAGVHPQRVAIAHDDGGHESDEAVVFVRHSRHFSQSDGALPKVWGSIGAEVSSLILLGVGREPEPTAVFCGAEVPFIGLIVGESEMSLPMWWILSVKNGEGCRLSYAAST